MYFKSKYFILIITLSFFGCGNIEGFTRTTTSLLSPIPKNVIDASKGSYNEESELSALGSSQIGDSGLRFAHAKSLVDAKNKLRQNIREEARMIFNSYALNMDFHTKKIFEPVFPDLADFVVEKEIEKAVEKGSWNDDIRAYTLVTVSRNAINTQCQNVFNEYRNYLASKINNLSSSSGATDEKIKKSSSSNNSSSNELDFGSLSDDTESSD